MRWESLGGLVLLDFDELLRRVRGGLAGADAADVLDDAGDIVVEFHHLLVVAPALVGGARLDGLAHEHVDLPQPALVVAQQEERVVLDQEAHVGRVLLGLPQRAVEPLRALSAPTARPPHPRLAGRGLRLPQGRTLVVSLGLGGKVVKLAFLFYFYHPQLYSQSIIGLQRHKYSRNSSQSALSPCLTDHQHHRKTNFYSVVFLARTGQNMPIGFLQF